MAIVAFIWSSGVMFMCGMILALKFKRKNPNFGDLLICGLMSILWPIFILSVCLKTLDNELECCGKCKFFDSDAKHCTKYPPRVHINGVTAWPHVNETDYCGEFGWRVD